MTLQEVADMLYKNGHSVTMHKSVQVASEEIVSVEVSCPGLLIPDRMKEIEAMLPENTFLLHPFRNTDSIYIIQKPNKS